MKNIIYWPDSSYFQIIRSFFFFIIVFTTELAYTNEFPSAPLPINNDFYRELKLFLKEFSQSKNVSSLIKYKGISHIIKRTKNVQAIFLLDHPHNTSQYFFHQTIPSLFLSFRDIQEGGPLGDNKFALNSLQRKIKEKCFHTASSESSNSGIIYFNKQLNPPSNVKIYQRQSFGFGLTHNSHEVIFSQQTNDQLSLDEYEYMSLLATRANELLSWVFLNNNFKLEQEILDFLNKIMDAYLLKSHSSSFIIKCDMQWIKNT